MLVCVCTCAWAAGNVSFRASVPSTVEVGGKFRVQFTVNTQDVSGFTAPDFKGFEVLYGPATSSQSSFQIINGQTSQSSSVIYSFVLLCNTPGTYTIGSASVQAGGKTVKTKPVQVKVLPSSGGSSSSSGSSRGGGSSASQSSASSDGWLGSRHIIQRPVHDCHGITH